MARPGHLGPRGDPLCYITCYINRFHSQCTPGCMGCIGIVFLIQEFCLQDCEGIQDQTAALGYSRPGKVSMSGREGWIGGVL